MDIEEQITKSVADIVTSTGKNLAEPSTKLLGSFLRDFISHEMINSDLVKKVLVDAELFKRFKQDLCDVPVEYLQNPNRKLAYPLTEEIFLRDKSVPVSQLAQALLASSFDTRFTDCLHPAIVNLLSDMASGEVDLLRLWGKGDQYFIVYRSGNNSEPFVYIPQQKEFVTDVVSLFLTDQLFSDSFTESLDNLLYCLIYNNHQDTIDYLREVNNSFVIGSEVNFPPFNVEFAAALRSLTYQTIKAIPTYKLLTPEKTPLHLERLIRKGVLVAKPFSESEFFSIRFACNVVCSISTVEEYRKNNHPLTI